MVGAPPDVQRSFVQNAPPDALARFRQATETPVGSLSGLTDIDLRGYADGGLVRGRGPGFASDSLRTLYDERYSGARTGNIGMGDINTRYDEAFADGGLVQGPGTSTSDSVLARLSKDEYVLPKESVEIAGLSQLEKLRQDGLALRGQEASDTAPRDERGLMMLAQGTPEDDYRRLMEEDERRKAAARLGQGTLTDQWTEAFPGFMKAAGQIGQGAGDFIGRIGQRPAIDDAAKAAIAANAERDAQRTIPEGSSGPRFDETPQSKALSPKPAAPTEKTDAALPEQPAAAPPAAGSALPDANPFAKMSDEALQAELANTQTLLSRMGGSLNPNTPQVQDYQALLSEMRRRNQQRPEGPAFQPVARLQDLQQRAALPVQGQGQRSSSSGKPSMDQAVADAMDLMINGQRAKSYQGLKVWSTENDNAWDRQVRAQAAQALSALSPYYQGATEQDAKRFELEQKRRQDALLQGVQQGDPAAMAAMRRMNAATGTKDQDKFRPVRVPGAKVTDPETVRILNERTGQFVDDQEYPTPTPAQIQEIRANRNDPRVIAAANQLYGPDMVAAIRDGTFGE
jgi:hypothetical protein